MTTKSMAKAVSESKLARAQSSARRLRKGLAETNRQIEKLEDRIANLKQFKLQQEHGLKKQETCVRLAHAELDAIEGDPAAALSAMALEDEVNA